MEVVHGERDRPQLCRRPLKREDALDNEVEVGVVTVSGGPVLDRIQLVREGGDPR